MAGAAVKDKPEIREQNVSTNDSRTPYNNPWFRLLINTLSGFLLGVNFPGINSGFFTSVAIFVISMLMDILRHRRTERITRFVYYLQLILLVASLILCLLGIIGILCIETVNDVPRIMVDPQYAFFPGVHFPARILLIMVFTCFFLTAIEIFASKTSAEKVL